MCFAQYQLIVRQKWEVRKERVIILMKIMMGISCHITRAETSITWNKWRNVYREVCAPSSKF